MKHLILLSLFISGLAFTATATAQRSAAQKGGNSDHRDVHRSLNQLESELLECLASQESVLGEWEQRNETLARIHEDKRKAEGSARQRLDARVDSINHQNRAASVFLQKVNVQIQRLQLEIDRLTRIDGHIIGEPGGRAPQSRRAQVKSIKNLKFTRQGPVRSNGRLGFNDTNLWEILYTDGTTQRLEEKVFTPIR